MNPHLGDQEGGVWAAVLWAGGRGGDPVGVQGEGLGAGRAEAPEGADGAWGPSGRASLGASGRVGHLREEECYHGNTGRTSNKRAA